MKEPFLHGLIIQFVARLSACVATANDESIASSECGYGHNMEGVKRYRILATECKSNS